MTIDKEKLGQLEEHWQGPVLSREVDRELGVMLSVISALRFGKVVQRRLRPSKDGMQGHPGGPWELFRLNLLDPVGCAQLSFHSWEYRLIPEKKAIMVWAAVSPSGRVMEVFATKESVDSYVNKLCLNVRIVALTSEVEVL